MPVWILAFLPQRVNPALVSSSVMIFWTLLKKEFVGLGDDFEGAVIENTLPAVVSSEREESAVGKITIALK